MAAEEDKKAAKLARKLAKKAAKLEAKAEGQGKRGVKRKLEEANVLTQSDSREKELVPSASSMENGALSLQSDGKVKSKKLKAKPNTETIKSEIDAIKPDESKKKKKRKKERKLVEHENGPGNLAEDVMNGVHGGNEAEDKQVAEPIKTKKKKKKHIDIQTEGVQLPIENAKIHGVVESELAAHLARIGDQDLAKQSVTIQKCLYSESSEVSQLSLSEIQEWQAERDVKVEGSSIRPILKFSQSGLPETMLHATRSFVSPSPIQAQCIPIAMSGRDLVGIAATGSGKTLAFGLPCLRHIQEQKARDMSGKGPRALMISPTRELAQQIASVMEEAGSMCGIKTICVYGGVPKHPQAQQLRRGVDIVVATPGRLEDLMNDGACKLNKISYLVLDEADRMLDLGFEPHIRAIASKVRADRQTLMFSATWPSEVQKLAFDYLSMPVRITIGSQDLSASHSVTQDSSTSSPGASLGEEALEYTKVVEVIEDRARETRLLELLQKYHKSRKNRVLVFVLYKKEASRVEEKLQRAGWKAASIHGDISQVQRSKAVEQFKSGQMPLLIATDVAARGLDIPDVEAVINYSFPLTTEDYVHRIGRTGRAGKTGIAHTFFVGVNDKARSGELVNVLKEAGQKVPDDLLKFGVTTKKKESKLYGAHFKDIDPSVKATKIVFDD